jgi:acyl-coenzyme A thioesterase PaaI-like protein
MVLGDDLYPARSGMPGHFGIRIADANKDKLVGELDVDDRHLNNSGHVHGGALAAFADDLGGRLAGPMSRLGSGQPRLNRRRISFAPACQGD